MKVEMKALTVTIHMMKMKLFLKRKELRKKRLLISLENIKESEKLLKMILCYFKMKYLQLNHYKEKFGPILKLHVV